MEIPETLESLLELFNYHTVHYSAEKFCIMGSIALPKEVSDLCTSFNYSLSNLDITSIFSMSLAESSLTMTYEYVFNNSDADKLRGILFLASEKQRYRKFCEQLENEVDNELSNNEYNDKI